jgi:UDP-galactopyranose mutase
MQLRSTTDGTAEYDWLVVGAGLTGATFARRMAEQSTARILVVDQRAHLAGNIYDSPDANGVRVQRYGAHIFHTGAAAIYEYLSRFTQWYRYEHRVLAQVGEHLVPVPFNFSSLDTFEYALPEPSGAIQRRLLAEFPAGARVPVAQLTRSNDATVRDVGEFIVETIFRGYTAKQWGRPFEDVDPAVLERVPVTMSYDDRYFRDDFQSIPREGYTAMVAKMLDHPSITVALDVDGRAEHQRRPHARLFWTGRVDAFFDTQFGELPYRSLRFDNVRADGWHSLPVAVINHPGPSRSPGSSITVTSRPARPDGVPTRSAPR